MQEETIKNASMWGAPGCAMVAWAMSHIFPDAPEFVVWAVMLIGAAMVGISAVYWLRFIFWPQPKQEVIDQFYELTIEGDQLSREEMKDKIADPIFYQKNTKEWIDKTIEFLKRETTREEVHMFSTIQPTISGNESVDVCRAALTDRVGKLRLITGRYFRGVNIARK